MNFYVTGEWGYIIDYTVLIALQFSSVQSLSHVRLFATPWNAARQASLNITNSRSLLKLMSVELVMPSSHLILCHPLLLLPPIPPSIRVFSNESTLHIRWPKYWSFSFNISPSNEHPGLNNGYELRQILGDGERQGNLVCIHRVMKSRTQLGYWTTKETLLAPFDTEGIWEQEKVSDSHQVLQQSPLLTEPSLPSDPASFQDWAQMSLSLRGHSWLPHVIQSLHLGHSDGITSCSMLWLYLLPSTLHITLSILGKRGCIFYFLPSLIATVPQAIAHQAPLPMEFSR